MPAAHVSRTAALLDSQHGGSLNGGQLKSRLQRADCPVTHCHERSVAAVSLFSFRSHFCQDEKANASRELRTWLNKTLLGIAGVRWKKSTFESTSRN
jgi:uncharacterized protein (DUF1501 family)